MTDVDMSTPLPAIPTEYASSHYLWRPTLVLETMGTSLTNEMTLAHLVQVIEALSLSQLRAVMGSLHPMVDGIADNFHDTLTRMNDELAQEKARADRAEQLLSLYRRGYEARGKLNVAYRIGSHPGEKTLDELKAVADKLKELETK